MAKTRATGLNFLTRRQITSDMKVPPRVVDEWIATGQLMPMRMSLGLGRGGQRLFYSVAEIERLKRARAGKGGRARQPRGL